MAPKAPLQCARSASTLFGPENAGIRLNREVHAPMAGLARQQIAALFEQMSRALALDGNDPFRALAYEKAARTLRGWEEDVTQLSVERLAELPGIGHDLAAKIAEGAETGHIHACEREIGKFPAPLLGLFEIRGLGPKTITLLHRKYGVAGVDDLRRLLASGDLAGKPGFGEAKIASLREAIQSWAGSAGRMLLGEALPKAEALLSEIRKLAEVEQAEAAGSLRRGLETVGDLDVVVTSRHGEGVLAQAARLDGVSEVLALGPTRASLLFGGLQVDIRAVAPAAFGAALLYFTGSKAHNTRLRGLARQRKWKLNEYGLFRGARRLAGASEAEIYRELGMAFIPPELREDRGEIEAAAAGRLPRLIAPGDVRGDFHAHTTYSDGRADVAAMVAAAEARGYEYVGLSDHSPSARIAHGLEPARLRRKQAELEAARRARGDRPPRILLGSEVDILPDGRLDYPDDVLAELDVVIAAVHANFKQSREQMTQRLLRAIANPCVRIVAHPTARLIGSRPPVDFDLERVAGAAARAGVALEVNGSPQRLDLKDSMARAALAAGAWLAIGSDAHSTAQYDNMRFGVIQARRGWVEADAVVNTWPWSRVEQWLAMRRQAARATA